MDNYPVQIDDIRSLPLRAQVAFAARCGRRALPLCTSTVLGRDYRQYKAIIKEVLRFAECCGAGQDHVATRSSNRFDMESTIRAESLAAFESAAHAVYNAARAAREFYRIRSEAESAGDSSLHNLAAYTAIAADELRNAKAAYDAAYAHDPTDAPEAEYLTRFHEYRKTLEYSVAARALTDDVRADFSQLHDTCKQGQWTDTTPVPTEFFTLNSTFDVNQHVDGKSIIDIASVVDARLVEHFRRNPTHLHFLSSRRFEEFIAELFRGFGFTVELTKQTRDGGRDIIAINHGIVRAKYLIECKRWKPTSTVGISVVQRLHGVSMSEGATKGIVATTSSFSAPAHQFLQKHEWVLEGRDLDGLTDWLQTYQQEQIDRVLELPKRVTLS